MTATEGYLKWPAEYGAAANWWSLADNWEATVLYANMLMFIVASAMIYSFGYEFRMSPYRNISFMVNFSALFVVTSVILLADSSDFTDLWHIASKQFNSHDTVSQVWVQYHADGGDTSPAMPFSLRLNIYVMICCFVLAAGLWQSVVLEGVVGDVIRKRYPTAKRVPYQV
jgi:cation-transporting ATPase 13A3/4/5